MSQSSLKTKEERINIKPELPSHREDIPGAVLRGRREGILDTASTSLGDSEPNVLLDEAQELYFLGNIVLIQNALTKYLGCMD
jgi:hypothetical protein